MKPTERCVKNFQQQLLVGFRSCFEIVLSFYFFASCGLGHNPVVIKCRLYIKQPPSSTSIAGYEEEPEWAEYKIKETNIFTADKYQQVSSSNSLKLQSLPSVFCLHEFSLYFSFHDPVVFS